MNRICSHWENSQLSQLSLYDNHRDQKRYLLMFVILHLTCLLYLVRNKKIKSPLRVCSSLVLTSQFLETVNSNTKKELLMRSRHSTLGLEPPALQRDKKIYHSNLFWLELNISNKKNRAERKGNWNWQENLHLMLSILSFILFLKTTSISVATFWLAHSACM